ncbi:MAG: hypothetical protein M1829_004779 [Trizodia sp. TS-e1964]|nr:MAG: hypothetical protein M1829_004779 [Trizodia sp. TS-e1964]
MPSQPRMPTQAEMLADAQLLADLDLPTEFSMLSENEPDEDLPDIPNVRLDPLTASEVEKQQSSPGRDKQPAAPPSSQPTDYQIPDSSQAPPEPQDSPDDPYQALATRFTEFLTVAIHTILYERNIYPRNSFLSARKYNFHVRQNRHPEVCGWITNAVKAVHVELLKGALYRVAVLIFSPDSVPVERFIFDVSGFPSPPRSKTSLHSISYGTIEDLEEELRASMLKISLCSAQLAEIPDDCSFTICIELKDEAGAPLGVSTTYCLTFK